MGSGRSSTRRIIDGGSNTISGASDVVDLDRVRPHHGANYSQPVAIQLLACDAALAGNIQVAIQDGSLDLTADASWSPVENGDLSLYASVGGGLVLVAPFTHLRLKVSAGDCEAILRI